MATQPSLNRTPLYQEHLILHAKMVPFGGWEMPVQYEGIINEYEQTRKAASIFDISHMGEFIIEGDPVKSGLDKIVTQSLVDLPVKSCRYGAMLNEDGGVLDDLIIFRLDNEKWFIVVNAATKQNDLAHFTANLSADAKLNDVSSQIGKLDIQGPLSREILEQFAPGIQKLSYYTFDFFDLLGENVLISRTGYTGELGFEIYYPWEKTSYLWNALLESEELSPAGLGARDLLRLEVGYSLYGHELNEDITALESGLKRFIDFDKDFYGKEALLQSMDSKNKRRIVGVVSNTRKSPRSEQNVYDIKGKKIGVITSGSFSPHLKRGIGLALIKSPELKIGDPIKFGTKDSLQEAVVSSKIFYKDGSLKQ